MALLGRRRCARSGKEGHCMAGMARPGAAGQGTAGEAWRGGAWRGAATHGDLSMSIKGSLHLFHRDKHLEDARGNNAD
jgi:hypothetical protein